MTPGMFMALQERRAAKFRHACYEAGIVAAAVWNSQRTQKDAPVASPWDFVPRPAPTERDLLKQNLLSLFSMVKGRPEDVERICQKTIERLKSEGHENVEELFDEIFPGWNQAKEKACQ